MYKNIEIRGYNSDNIIIQDMRYYPNEYNSFLPIQGFEYAIDTCVLNFIHFMSVNCVEVDVIDLDKPGYPVIRSTK